MLKAKKYIVMTAISFVTGGVACGASLPTEYSAELDSISTRRLAAFDSAAWKSGRRSPFMMYDLVHRYRLIGMRRSDLYQLLGEPELSSNGAARLISDPGEDLFSAMGRAVGYCRDSSAVTYLSVEYSNDLVKRFRVKALDWDDNKVYISHWKETNLTQ
jgi:hypothetical protein